ncbi:MAG TPA: phosphoribosylformylglycinamidine synthase subunit PurL [Nitrospiria bacterium]|nr:phosphoribosylformylglycinamidine synthase subunit PurL [Nitrospiria bacterium]HUK56494.1 phosphoribosylformylglycinamidine synthase subunit PurL [Nitrospiria bacterium]
MNGQILPPDALEQHGLTQEEYQKILALLGRDPNHLELGLFSVMWSEHCSYKSSKVHLKKLPTTGECVVQGPGENAGAVDIGDGQVAVFKIESHNHPSFIEPYQGAATGVGGILRDIFTMGARPIALLNSLRFGSLDIPKNRYLLEGVVAGIAGYGNCMGVPTVGGEIYFNEIYNQNPLVNVFCLGIAEKDRIFRASARGVGNTVIYIGSKTGRDGIHGATMASESFDESIEARRPMVQVGDPFTEKLLLEACLEIMKRELIVGIQDMGAAGLTSSSVEMAGRAGTGIELEITDVPRREERMTPYEVMLSESQERMLLVAKPGFEKEILDICDRWDLDAAVIGRVTDTRRLVIREEDRIVADLPIRALTDDAPVYERPIQIPSYLDALQGINLDLIPQPSDLGAALVTLLASPIIANKRWIYQQYDHMVRTNTVVRPGFESAVVRIKGTRKALALSVDGNSRYGILNPYRGGVIAVCEAARNVVCAGGRPIGLTDCLNFGNPERPEVMWQFALSVEGIADACRELEIPVVSGNVSFYNETNSLGIYPTPIIGMVGLIEEAERVVRPGFRDEGDRVVLLGKTKEDLGGTEYLSRVHSREGGFPPLLELAEEKAVQRCCLDAIEAGIIKSAHDCSEGGLAVALAEAVMMSGDSLGATVVLPDVPIRRDAHLFGETQSRIVVTVNESALPKLEHHCVERNVPMAVIGRVEGRRLTIRAEGEDRPLIDLSVETMRTAWEGAIESYFRAGETQR